MNHAPSGRLPAARPLAVTRGRYPWHHAARPLPPCCTRTYVASQEPGSAPQESNKRARARYDVESIVDARSVPDKRCAGGERLEYKVRWVGYTAEDDTWETRASFFQQGDTEAVLAFERQTASDADAEASG